MEQVEARDATDSLWLTFKLREQIFAVDAGCIHSIFLASDDIEPIPQYPDTIRGVMSLRGQIVPMLDLRKYLHYPSIVEEYTEFMEMLETRKQDHIHWVEALEHFTHSDEAFTLATDPHKCAFGKWYDHFHSTSSSVSFHMAKIAEPHSNLHAMALRAIECKDERDAEKREECLAQTLHEAADVYMPRVVQLLDEAKEIFRAHYREMCVVIADGDRQLGLIVDEVLSAATLEQVGTGADIGPFSRSEIVLGVAHCATVPGEILMMDSGALMNLIVPSTVLAEATAEA